MSKAMELRAEARATGWRLRRRGTAWVLTRYMQDRNGTRRKQVVPGGGTLGEAAEKLAGLRVQAGGRKVSPVREGGEQ